MRASRVAFGSVLFAAVLLAGLAAGSPAVAADALAPPAPAHDSSCGGMFVHEYLFCILGCIVCLVWLLCG